MVSMSYCQNCGKQVDTKDGFCVNCGSKIESLKDEFSINNSSVQNSMASPRKKHKKKNKAKLDPLFFVAIGIGFIFLLFLLFL